MSAWDGRPQNPEKDGFHWVLTPDGEEATYLWRAGGECERGHWPDGWIYAANEWNPTDCTYLGPCLTPAEVAAAVQAERAACAAYLTHHAKRLRLRDAQERGIPDAMGHSFEANAADAWAKGILARGDTSALDAAIKAAYRKGWNDREAYLLAGAARIVGKPAP